MSLSFFVFLEDNKHLRVAYLVQESFLKTFLFGGL